MFRFYKRIQTEKLVYFEETDDIEAAISREKAMKKWNRQWKLDLIEKKNPDWQDLFSGF